MGELNIFEDLKYYPDMKDHYRLQILMKFSASDPIKKVLFRDPATIVFWSDGTKTVVKASNEEYDPEKGLAMAISKKFLGNGGNYYNEFKKWLPTQETEENQ